MFRTFLDRMNLHGLDRRLKKALGVHKAHMSHPPYDADTHRLVKAHIDVVRYGAIALALHRLNQEGVAGAMAELGVFKGELSAFLATVEKRRTLHLFDTFAGFPDDDLERGETSDPRFRDTSEEAVRRRIGDCSNVRFHVGAFPGTAGPIMEERFAFVMLDPDKYKPTLAGLEIFYPRMSPGGYMFLHDYNNPESDFAVSRAAHDFLKDKPERLIDIPDAKGTVFFRRH
jgi:O-methyltransferase